MNTLYNSRARSSGRPGFSGADRRKRESMAAEVRVDTSEPSAATAGGPIIIGAGPAGLTAAYQLSKAGIAATILESDTVVGGISRTVERDGWRFDIGGHRFFTKVGAVDDLWFEILGRRGVPAAPTDEPHALPGQALRLPARVDERAAQHRTDRGGPLRALVHLGPDPPAEGHEQPRRFLHRAVRHSALRALLQALHREGLGRAVHADLVRLGRAAREGHVADPRHHRGAQAEGDQGPALKGQADHAR